LYFLDVGIFVIGLLRCLLPGLVLPAKEQSPVPGTRATTVIPMPGTIPSKRVTFGPAVKLSQLEPSSQTTKLPIENELSTCSGWFAETVVQQTVDYCIRQSLCD
jgi:hypothetical protein